MEEEPPPWFFLRYYRYLEEYGAICIGSPYTHGYSLRKQPDGTFTRDETPLERGVQLNTREDVIRLRLGMGTSQEDIERRKAKGVGVEQAAVTGRVIPRHTSSTLDCCLI